MSKNKIQLFQEQSVKSNWDKGKEICCFSIIHVVKMLTEEHAFQIRNYWGVLKYRFSGAKMLKKLTYQFIKKDIETFNDGLVFEFLPASVTGITVLNE